MAGFSNTPNTGPCCATSYYQLLFAIERVPTLGSSIQFRKLGKTLMFSPLPNRNTIGTRPIQLWLVNDTYKTLLACYAQMPGRSEWANLWRLGKVLELSAANLQLIGSSIQRAASMARRDRWRQEGWVSSKTKKMLKVLSFQNGLAFGHSRGE